MKLSQGQWRILWTLANAGDRPDVLLKGRGPLASAAVLGRLGLAEQTGGGYFNGERWRLTDEGRRLAESKERWRPVAGGWELP